MSAPLITAIGPRWEGDLAEAFDRNSRVHLVRRCADLPELLASVDAGLGRLAVVSADLRGLDRTAVAFLIEQQVTPIGVYAPADVEQDRRLRRYGIAVTIAADAAAPEIDAALALALTGEPATGTAAEDLDLGPDGPPRAAPGEAGSSGGATGDQAPSAHRGESGASRHPRPDLLGELESADDEADDNEADGDAGAGGAGGANLPPGTAPGEDEGSADGSGQPRRGRVVAIWGTPGAPGRTSTAVNLAAELSDAEPTDRSTARDGFPARVPALVIDADTQAASVAQMLAVLDEAPGLAAATRLADQGRLTATALLSVAPVVMPGLRVLTGLPRADRWPELSDHAIADVIEVARQVANWVVIDCAYPVERDEDITFDTRAPRRHGATLTVLAEADEIVVVGAGDPVGLQRLIRSVGYLVEVSDSRITVAVAKVRASAVGSDPAGQVRNALHRFAGIEDPVLISDDRAGLDAALLAGRALREIRPSSPARRGYLELGRRIGAVSDAALAGQLRRRRGGVRRRPGRASGTAEL